MKKNVESVKMSRYEAYKQFGEISKDEDDIEYVIRQKFDKDGFLGRISSDFRPRSHRSDNSL